MVVMMGFEADGVVRAPGSERDVRLFAAGLA